MVWYQHIHVGQVKKNLFHILWRLSNAENTLWGQRPRSEHLNVLPFSPIINSTQKVGSTLQFLLKVFILTKQKLRKSYETDRTTSVQSTSRSCLELILSNKNRILAVLYRHQRGVIVIFTERDTVLSLLSRCGVIDNDLDLCFNY